MQENILGSMPVQKMVLMDSGDFSPSTLGSVPTSGIILIDKDGNLVSSGGSAAIALVVSGVAGVGNTLMASFPTGTGTVKWQESADNGATWTDISGATSLSFVQTSTQAGKLVRPVATSYFPYGATTSVPAYTPGTLYFPRLLLIGPSTTFRNSSILTNQAGWSGMAQWAAAMRKGAYFDHRLPITGTGTRDNRAADGAEMADYVNQINECQTIQTNATPGTKFVIGFSPGRNDLSGGMDVATYMARFRSRCNEIDSKLQYEAVVVEGLWQRMSSNGGVWGVGGAARAAVKQLNIEMAAECAARGSKYHFVDENTVMRDPTGIDEDPRAADLASDGVHYAAQGARRVGEEAIYPVLSTIMQPRNEGAANPNNILPTFTGTTGTLGNGATGVVYTGWEVAREAADHTVVASQVTVDGKPWTQLVITANTSTPSKSGGTELRLTDVAGILHGKAAGTLMGMRVKIRVAPTNVNYGLVVRLRDLGGTATTALGTSLGYDLGFNNATVTTDSSTASLPMFWEDKTLTLDREYTTSLLQLKAGSGLMPLVVVRPGYSATSQSMTVLIGQPETFIITTA